MHGGFYRWDQRIGEQKQVIQTVTARSAKIQGSARLQH